MAREQVKVIGAARLTATLHLAARRVQNQERPGAKAAALIATRGRAQAPRRTGRLAASVRSTADANQAEATSSLAYAARTHWGYRRYAQAPQPFLWEPAEALQPTWTGYYADEVNRLLNTVKGA